MPNWPDKYVIVGSKAQLEGLTDIPELYVSDHGRTRDDDDTWSVTVFATGAAAALAAGLGCTVTLIQTGDQQEQAANDEIAGRTGPDAGGVG